MNDGQLVAVNPPSKGREENLQGLQVVEHPAILQPDEYLDSTC